MAYIGATPANTFQSLTSQTLTGDGGTSYTLNTSVSTAADIAVFVNNVRQNPNSSYTASGTSLSMSAAVSSSDSFYVVYLGKAVGTINPASGSVGTSQIVDSNVTGAKFASDVISAQTELASEPADTDEFLVSDAGVLKRLDYSLIKSSPSETLITSTSVSGASAVTFTGIDATYPALAIKIRNVYLSTSAKVQMQFIQGGGSVETGTYYDQYITRGASNSSTFNATNLQTTVFQISGNASPFYGYVGDIKVYGPGITDRYVRFISQTVHTPTDTSASAISVTGGAFRRSIATYGSAITGIKIFPASGTFSGPGKIELYGVN